MRDNSIYCTRETVRWMWEKARADKHKRNPETWNIYIYLDFIIYITDDMKTK